MITKTESVPRPTFVSFFVQGKDWPYCMHRDEQEIRNLVIAVQDNGGNPLSEQDPTISTVTTTTTDDSMVTTVASFGSSNNQSRQCFRKLSKQASTVHLERKTAKEESMTGFTRLHSKRQPTCLPLLWLEEFYLSVYKAFAID